MQYIEIVLGLLLFISVYTDLRFGKIYNSVILTGLVISCAYHVLSKGFLPGVCFWGAGFLVGICLFLIPYLLGGMGGGDVKLLGMVGAFMGTFFILYAVLITAISGGVISLLTIAYKGVRWQGLLPVYIDREAVKTISIPYAIPIVLGTLITYVVM